MIKIELFHSQWDIFKQMYYHNTWGELLVLHQGTQASITVNGALLSFAKILVPLGRTTVQTTEQKKHNMGFGLQEKQKEKISDHNVHRNIEFRTWDLDLVLEYVCGDISKALFNPANCDGRPSPLTVHGAQRETSSPAG